MPRLRGGDLAKLSAQSHLTSRPCRPPHPLGHLYFPRRVEDPQRWSVFSHTHSLVARKPCSISAFLVFYRHNNSLFVLLEQVVDTTLPNATAHHEAQLTTKHTTAVDWTTTPSPRGYHHPREPVWGERESALRPHTQIPSLATFHTLHGVIRAYRRTHRRNLFLAVDACSSAREQETRPLRYATTRS